MHSNTIRWAWVGLLKHSDWLRLKVTSQSQEILLGHYVFASSEYGITQLPSYCTLD